MYGRIVFFLLTLVSVQVAAQQCPPYSIATVGGANSVGYYNTGVTPNSATAVCLASRLGDECVGRGNEGTGGYQPLMKQALSSGPTPIEIYNYGASDLTINDWPGVANQIIGDFAPGSLDLVLLLGGTEDILAGVSVSLIASRLEQAVSQALLSGQYVLIGTIPPISDPQFSFQVDSLNSRIRSRAAQENVAIADLNARLRGNWSSYSFDGYTANPSGHQVMADVWIETIYRALEEASNDLPPRCRTRDAIFNDGKTAVCADLDRGCTFGILDYEFFGEKIRTDSDGVDVFAYDEELGLNVSRQSGSNAVYTISWIDGINRGAIDPFKINDEGEIDPNTRVDEFSVVKIKEGFVGEFSVAIRAHTNFASGEANCCYLPWDFRILDAIIVKVRIEKPKGGGAGFVPSVILLLSDEEDE